jgi:signal transduction histidine kinase
MSALQERLLTEPVQLAKINPVKRAIEMHGEDRRSNMSLVSSTYDELISGDMGAPLVDVEKASKLLKPALTEVSDELDVRVHFHFGQQSLTVGPQTIEEGYRQSIPLRLGAKDIGFVEVKSLKPLNESQTDTLKSIFSAFAANWQRRWMIEVVKSLTEPIPLEGSAFDYNCALSQMIMDLFFCDHVFLRRFDGRSFTCIGYAGTEDDREFENHKITEGAAGDIYNFLLTLIHSANESNLPTVANIEGHEFEQLLSSIRDIVFDKDLSCATTTPLLVGGKPYGVISLLFRNAKDAHVLQDEILSLVANHVAMAMSHFDKANELAKDRSDRAMKARDKFNFEVIQGLRHSASNNLASLQMNFQSLKTRIKGPLLTESAGPLQRVETDIELLAFDLSNMERLTALKNEGSSVFQFVDIKQIFEECLNLLPGNKSVKSDSRKKIRHNIQSPRLPALCEPDFLRYAFLNLIMNSVRAINDKKQHSNNESITFVGRDIGDRFQIDISDTGGGIPIGQGGIQSMNDIWEEGKTSKSNGTGQGLVMVRDAVQVIHQGTISILDNDPNLTLRIEMPKFPAGDKEKYSQLVRGSSYA